MPVKHVTHITGGVVAFARWCLEDLRFGFRCFDGRVRAPLGVAHLRDEFSRGGSDFLLVLNGGR